MTLESVRKLLLRRAKGSAKYKNSTGVKAWCTENGVQNSHACEFLNGKRLPTTDLLEALGLEWRVMRRSPAASNGARGGEAMSKCEICGETLPEGEEMFRYHGFSGNCPAPATKDWRELSFKEQSQIIVEHQAKIVATKLK